MLHQEYNKAEELVIQLKAYVDIEIELVKLNAADKLSKVIADFTVAIVVCTFFLLFILFASLSLAWMVGEWLDKIWAGFLIIAILYLFVGATAWFAREKLLRVPVMNAIIRRLFSQDQHKQNIG